MDIDHKSEDGYAWFITRGTELCDVSESICKFFFFFPCDVFSNNSHP